MLPRLYQNATKIIEGHDFDNNGYGFFNQCTKCDVTEERNGEYFAEIEIGANDRLIDKVSPGMFVKAKPNPKDPPQLFEVNEVVISKNGSASIKANHIKSYFFNNVIRPAYYSAFDYKLSGTVEEIINSITQHTRLLRPSEDDEGKTYLYQKVMVSGFDGQESKTLPLVLDTHLSIDTIFNDSSGIIANFGGEFYFNNFKVYFKKNRGSKTNKVIRYGSSISDYSQTIKNEDNYTSIFPYAKFSNSDEGDIIVEGDVVSTNKPIVDAYFQRVLVKDFSDKFKSKKWDETTKKGREEIKEQLNFLAGRYAVNHNAKLIQPSVNMNVTYQPELNKLQDIGLCDTVKVIYGPLRATHTAKVIKTVYDSINERYKEIEIGEKKYKLTDFLKKSNRR